MNNRILHGFEEVSGQVYFSVQGLREQNYSANSVLKKRNPFGYSCDRCLNIDGEFKRSFPIKLLQVFKEEFLDILTYKVFHFHYGKSLMYNLDLPILKLFGKKVFIEFHGSDLRDPILAHELNSFDVVENGLTVKHKLLIKLACIFSDGIILHDDELLPYLPKKHSNVYVVPLRMDPVRYQPNYVDEKNTLIKIVHAPTNSYLKGSEYIEAAIAKLQTKYNIEYVRIEKLKHEQAIDIYKTADIIVDQIRTGTYGVLAIEGMALGKPVITFIMDRMTNCFPDELPIVSATIENIESVIENLVIDGEKRKKLGIAGRKYVELYHDYRYNSIFLSKIYFGKQGTVHGRDAFDIVKNVKFAEERRI